MFAAVLGRAVCIFGGACAPNQPLEAAHRVRGVVRPDVVVQHVHVNRVAAGLQRAAARRAVCLLGLGGGAQRVSRAGFVRGGVDVGGRRKRTLENVVLVEPDARGDERVKVGGHHLRVARVVGAEVRPAWEGFCAACRVRFDGVRRCWWTRRSYGVLVDAVMGRERANAPQSSKSLERGGGSPREYRGGRVGG